MNAAASSKFPGFEPTLLQFLEELADNNHRSWFQANKGRYERDVLKPCLAFIQAFPPRLKRISPYFVASDQRVGGSLMRVYRDTRFAKDASPYKTNVGIQFRHEFGRDVHAPGFYVHLAPGECFLAVGVWRPDAQALTLIRQAIVDRPDRWKRAWRDRRFRALYNPDGSQLKRPPRGYPPDHPLVEDLKRTDFVAVQDVTEQDVLEAKFVDQVAASFAATRPFMRFLCDGLQVPF